jgi:hypothetical protein
MPPVRATASEIQLVKAAVEYPFRDAHPPGRQSLLRAATSFIESAKVTRRRKREGATVAMDPVGAPAPLSPDDLVLICISHNDINLLPQFMEHYRRLGVHRFVFIDDRSDDGTVEFLRAERDVDLWTSPVRYKDARRGKLWRESLMAHYGFNRWYVNVDSDEFLVFDKCAEYGLRDLIDVLVDYKITRLPAPMIDMYSKADETAIRGRHPWLFSKWYDGSGYLVEFNKRAISIKGGPRRRVFGEHNELMKYPVIYWDRSCSFGVSIHQPLPYQRNFSFIWGALLHFKFYTDYADKIKQAAEAGQHYDGAAHYRRMNDAIAATGHLDLHAEVSHSLNSFEQLREQGFIPKIPYEQVADYKPASLWKTIADQSRVPAL